MLMISSPLSSLFFGEKVEWLESSKILEWPGIQPGRQFLSQNGVQAHTAGSTFSLFFFPCFTLKTCRDDMSSDGPPRDDMCLPLPGKVEYSTAARKKYYCAREGYPSQYPGRCH